MAPSKTKREQLREWTEVKPGQTHSLARVWRQEAGHSPEHAALAVKVSSRSVTRYELGSPPRDELRINSYYAYLKKIQPKEDQ